MRKAINENQTVQLAILGVLALAIAILAVPRLIGGGDDASDAPPAVPTADAGAAAIDVGVDSAPVDASGELVAPSAQPDPAAAGPAAVPAGAPSPEALVPGPGMPAHVLAAHEAGKTVALLFVRAGGVDDRLVRRAAAQLANDRGVALFVVRAAEIANYARITQGVGVSRVPALVVVSPDAGGGVPRAEVSYGFRSAQSLAQAVRDAAYRGPTRAYHPE